MKLVANERVVESEKEHCRHRTQRRRTDQTGENSCQHKQTSADEPAPSWLYLTVSHDKWRATDSERAKLPRLLVNGRACSYAAPWFRATGRTQPTDRDHHINLALRPIPVARRGERTTLQPLRPWRQTRRRSLWEARLPPNVLGELPLRNRCPRRSRGSSERWNNSSDQHNGDNSHNEQQPTPSRELLSSFHDSPLPNTPWQETSLSQKNLRSQGVIRLACTGYRREARAPPTRASRPPPPVSRACRSVQRAGEHRRRHPERCLHRH